MSMMKHRNHYLQSLKISCIHAGYFLYFVGMCMCLSFFTIQTTDKPVLISGYENGQLLLWDVMEQKVMSTKTVHNETGMQ